MLNVLQAAHGLVGAGDSPWVFVLILGLMVTFVVIRFVDDRRNYQEDCDIIRTRFAGLQVRVFKITKEDPLYRGFGRGRQKIENRYLIEVHDSDHRPWLVRLAAPCDAYGRSITWLVAAIASIGPNGPEWSVPDQGHAFLHAPHLPHPDFPRPSFRAGERPHVNVQFAPAQPAFSRRRRRT